MLSAPFNSAEGCRVEGAPDVSSVYLDFTISQREQKEIDTHLKTNGFAAK